MLAKVMIENNLKDGRVRQAILGAKIVLDKA
jgi:hypothetical protein